MVCNFKFRRPGEGNDVNTSAKALRTSGHNFFCRRPKYQGENLDLVHGRWDGLWDAARCDTGSGMWFGRRDSAPVWRARLLLGFFVL